MYCDLWISKFKKRIVSAENYMRKYSIFSRGWNEGGRKGCHSHQHHNIWFLWYEELLIWISSYLHWSPKLRGLQFHFINFIKQLKMGIPTLWPCHFKSSRDIMTKFEYEALHVIRIKCWKVGGCGNPPSFPPPGT